MTASKALPVKTYIRCHRETVQRQGEFAGMKNRIMPITQTTTNRVQREFGLLTPRNNDPVSHRENRPQITPDTKRYPRSIFTSLLQGLAL